jgi:hypothetical protein
MVLSDLLDIAVFAWLALWAVVASRTLLRGEKQSIAFVILVHFVLIGLPAALNICIGPALYFPFPAFVGERDASTDLLYAGYVCLCPVLWWTFGRSRTHLKRSQHDSASTMRALTRGLARFRYFFYLVASCPIIVLLFAPDPTFYSQYGAIVRASPTEEILAFHKWMLMATLLSILAIAAIWAISRRLLSAVIATSPLLVTTVWLSGKRFIVFLAIALLILTIWERRLLRGWRLGLACLTLFSVFGAFSYAYQDGVRGGDALAFVKKYDDFRIDYGRDHGIRHALYCELHPGERPILEYRGQGVLFDATMLIPRDLWPDKPWPYAAYSTASAIGVIPQDLGWTITASWLERAVAEFGLLGMLIGPTVIAGICRLGDASKNTGVQLLTIIHTCLMLSMTSSFPAVKIAWMLSMLFLRLRGRKRKKAGEHVRVRTQVLVA